MNVFGYVGAVSLLLLAVATVLVGHDPWHERRVGDRRDLLRGAGVAALSALTSGTSYTATLQQPDIVPLAIANGALIFTPGMLWATARRVNGGAVTDMLPPAVAAVVVAALTLLTPGEAIGLKCVVVATFCALLVRELRRGALRELAGAVGLAVTAATFGAYAFAYGVAGVLTDARAGHGNTVLSPGPATIVAMGAITAVCICVFRMSVALDLVHVSERGGSARLRAEALSLLERSERVLVWTITNPDRALIRAAHGGERARRVTSAMGLAARGALPGALVAVRPGGVVMAVTPAVATDDAEQRLRAAFSTTSPRIAHDELPELKVAVHRVDDAAQLARLMTPRPWPWPGRDQPAVPFG